MAKNWKTWLSWLISPLAIGFYITLGTVALNWMYYHPSPDREELGLINMMRTAHQKSFDYRLQVRGPRQVDKSLALLTVDERALETIGRWPWSREILGNAIDRAVKDGAKVLAFDIVFSEPQTNPALAVINEAKAGGGLDGPFEQKLMTFKDRLDADAQLGKVFANDADHIVAGAFAREHTPLYSPETDFCRDLIFKRTPEAKQWDKEEVLLSVNDPYTPYIPAMLVEFFNGVLETREKAVIENFGAVKNKNDEVRLDARIRTDLHEACNTILDDWREELSGAWNDVVSQEDAKEFQFKSYDEWVQNLKQRSFRNATIAMESWVLNTPTIAAGTKHTGHFNTELDTDGTIRSKGMVVRTGNSYFPSISLKAFLVSHNYNAAPKIEINAASGEKEIVGLEVTDNETGDPVFTIPVDPQGKLLLNYAGPEKMYPYISFADLVSDSPEAEIEQRVWVAKDQRWDVQKTKVKKKDFLFGKTLVVGATATGIFDLRVTPFQENYPGAETHLNAIDNMIQRNFFRTVADEEVYMPIVLGVVGVLLAVPLSFLGALWGILLTGAALVGTWYIDSHYFFGQGIVVTIVWPLLLIAFLYTSLTFYRYLTEERGKKELRQTFQKYVSPAIVEEILSHPENINLGGRKMNLTVFFSDLRGFTTISEKLDPRALSDLLNEYLTPMTKIVFSNQGTLDKYMGDAIMAFFGAPVAYKDHAKYACRCALQSIDKLFELQKQFEKKGLPTIDLGIGLNTGEVSVGNMGSETVRSYTVMGDAVNLASRLEGINKTYGTRIILSEMTYNEVKDNFIAREVDWVRVKGKVLPVKIYELLGEEKIPSPKLAEMLKHYQEGYIHYHERAWQKGLAAFGRALDIQPNDEVSKLYVERCQDFLTTPPDDSWDGVFIMKTK